MKRTSVNITFVSLENLLPFAERMKTSSTTPAEDGYLSLVTGPRQPPMTYPILELARVASSSVRNNNPQSGPLELISNVILQPEHLVMCDVPPAVRGLQTLHQGETRLFYISPRQVTPHTCYFCYWLYFSFSRNGLNVGPFEWQDVRAGPVSTK